MNFEEYDNKLKELSREFEEKKKQLYRDFAYSNNPYKEGDIFTDHIGSILIKKIGVYVSFDLPECVYTGLELKKDGTPTKKGNIRQAYQSNDIKKQKLQV